MRGKLYKRIKFLQIQKSKNQSINQKIDRLQSIIIYNLPKIPFIMQEQNHNKYKHLSQLPNDDEILQLIQTTFQSKTTAQVSNAQAALTQLLEHQTFIQKLLYFLQHQNTLNTEIKNKDQFKTSVSILIKRFTYQYSKNQDQNKDFFLQKLFCLIISNLNSRAKQQLGTALQYILNHDQLCTYKPKVIQKVTQILESQPQNHVLEGALIISTACLNSLIEVDEQFDFIWAVIDSLTRNAIKILQYLKKQPLQTLTFPQNKSVIKLSGKLFQLMELGVSRIMEEEDLLEDKVQLLRTHPSLQLLFFSYLSAFSHHKSILSTFIEINAVKSTVVEIIFRLFRTRPMSQNIFNLFFITLLLEAQKQSYQEEEEHIVTRVIQLLEDYLDNKFYVQTFNDHKMQTLMSLLTYSVTKPEEFDMIEEQPQKFVQLAEQFTQAFKGSTNVKVRAASFLKVFASRFDQALRNILEIIVIIVTAYLESDDPKSPCLQLYSNLKNQFSSMIFFHLDPTLQVQTCFNILSLLSNFINKRDDLKKVVYAIFITHFERLQKIDQPIIVLRIIRTIGYYPTALYYNVIKTKMGLGKTFVLEGLKSFERILKANRYPQIFDLLSEIFTELIAVMNVSDHIFETIVLNHYQRILKKNLTLYNNFLIKIRDSFIQSLQKNPHFAFTCLGYIYSILNKENESSYRHKIMEYFMQMEQFYNNAVEFYRQKLAQNPVDSSIYQTNKRILNIILNYEQKIVDIYSILVKKETNINQKMIQFSMKKLRNLSDQNRNGQIFKLYNNLFLKVDNQFDQIQVYYQAFMQQLRNMFSQFLSPQQTLNNRKSFNGKQNLDILPNLSYLVSQIFACFYEVHLKKQDVEWMMKVLNSLTQDLRQYLLLIILTYAYAQPIKLRQLLKSMNLYQETLKSLLTTNYTEGLIRKIFLLAMSKMLEIQDNYFQDILRQCIAYLNEQYKQNQTRKKRKQHVDPKMRRMLQDYDETNQEEMIQENNSSIKKISCCVPEFKHPYSALSEYDQFKIRIWHNVNVIEKLSEKDKNELREILRMDWIGKGVRKIVSVKQPFDSF